MAVLSLEELYERFIKPLPAGERLRLISMTAQDLTASQPLIMERPTESAQNTPFPAEFTALLEEIAPLRGLSAQELAGRWLAQQQASASATPKSPEKTDEAFRLQFAGAYASGNPNAADNDLIDADLAREYHSLHEDEHAA